MKLACTDTCRAALVVYAPKPKKKEGINLLSGEAAEKRPAEELASEEGPVPWISFLKPNVTITMVDDFSAHPAERIPEHVSVRILCEFCSNFGIL